MKALLLAAAMLVGDYPTFSDGIFTVSEGQFEHGEIYCRLQAATYLDGKTAFGLFFYAYDDGARSSVSYALGNAAMSATSKVTVLLDGKQVLAFRPQTRSYTNSIGMVSHVFRSIGEERATLMRLQLAARSASTLQVVTDGSVKAVPAAGLYRSLFEFAKCRPKTV